MTISYFISVPTFKSTAFVVWVSARREEGGRGGNFNATSEPPWTIGLTTASMECL